MLPMDMPYVPPQDTPIVLVQAATPAAGATPQPDYILKVCTETEHAIEPNSAMRIVNPAGMLRVFLQAKEGRRIEPSAVRNIAILQNTSHGKITSGYAYDLEPEYLGDDRAVFLAEFEGKVYKIVVDIKVLYIVDDNSNQCPEPQLIKVKKPSIGSSGYDMGSVTVTFASFKP